MRDTQQSVDDFTKDLIALLKNKLERDHPDIVLQLLDHVRDTGKPWTFELACELLDRKIKKCHHVRASIN